MLQDVIDHGTAVRAKSLGRPDLAGKTGTTNDERDAWFAGFQPGRVAVVWLGYDEPRSLGSHASGASLALPAWIDYMATALKEVPVHELAAPEGVVQVDGHWRYTEWAPGGHIASLGLDEQTIGPALIPQVPQPALEAPPAPPQ